MSAIHIPDAYRGQISNYLGDIALVELQDPVPPGLSIATVCVDPALTLVPEESLRVAGWGDEFSALDVLEYVNMPFLPTKTCYRRASDTLIKYVTADKFCSIVQSGKPHCLFELLGLWEFLQDFNTCHHWLFPVL